MATDKTMDDDGLTDEERAALVESDKEDADAAALIEKDEDDEAGNEAGENDATAGADSATRDDGKGADDGKTTPTAEEEAAAATAAAAAESAKADPATQASVNTLVTEAQAAVTAKQKEFDDAKAANDAALKVIADAKAKLDQDIDDGEITMVEFRKKLDDLNKQERDAERSLDKHERELERATDKATGLADQERNRGKEEWDKQCAEFLDANKAYMTDNTKMQMLNSYVITIAKSEPALTGPQILAKAHRIVSGEPEPAATAADKKTVKKVEAKKPELVPNLSKLPAAEGTDTGSDGRWASLDRLRDKDYDAYEKKLGEMSSADQDAYLRAD